MTEEDDPTPFLLAGLEELRGYTEQPPATPGRIDALLAAFERSKRRLIVHPSRVAEYEAAVYGAGLGIALRVEPHPWLKPDQVFLMQSEAEFEADMQAAMERGRDQMLAEIREQLAAEVAARLAELEDEARQERERDYLRAVYAAQRPNWPGFITGI